MPDEAEPGKTRNQLEASYGTGTGSGLVEVFYVEDSCCDAPRVYKLKDDMPCLSVFRRRFHRNRVLRRRENVFMGLDNIQVCIN